MLIKNPETGANQHSRTWFIVNRRSGTGFDLIGSQGLNINSILTFDWNDSRIFFLCSATTSWGSTFISENWKARQSLRMKRTTRSHFSVRNIYDLYFEILLCPVLGMTLFDRSLSIYFEIQEHLIEKNNGRSWNCLWLIATNSNCVYCNR